MDEYRPTPTEAAYAAIINVLVQAIPYEQLQGLASSTEDAMADIQASLIKADETIKTGEAQQEAFSTLNMALRATLSAYSRKATPNMEEVINGQTEE